MYLLLNESMINRTVYVRVLIVVRHINITDIFFFVRSVTSDADIYLCLSYEYISNLVKIIRATKISSSFGHQIY